MIYACVLKYLFIFNINATPFPNIHLKSVSPQLL